MSSLIDRRPGPDRFDRRLLAPMMLGATLNPINTSILAVALVPIAVAFGAPASETAWLVSALYLATSIGQPLVGRLVDMFGPRRLFLIGGLLTAVAGVMGVVAPSLGVLIAARVILGLGTCAGYPAAMHLIRQESDRTGMRSPAGVLTALSITTQTIAIIGPTLGGLLIDIGGWRATFGVNIPLGLASVILGALLLPSDPRVAPGASRRLDLLGVILFAGALASLLLFMMDIRIETAWLLVVTAIVGAAFAWWELRQADPFIELRVLAGNVPLLLTYGRQIMVGIVSYCFVYGFTPWLEGGRGLSPSVAGLILIPTFGVGVAVAAVLGRRPAVRWKLLVGSVAQIAAAALVLLVWDDAPIWFLLAIAAVLGIPQGLVNLAIQNTLYHQADPERIGAASGLLRTFMYLGAMVSSAATGAFFGEKADSSGMHDIAWFMLGAAVLLLAITVFDRSLRRIDRLERGEDQLGEV